ncbi:hypothetical protein BV25DRAFT_1922135 [Artomyces pyxidatus]|uniref:Uncharacterized protein n=1 Tax=Artomyces pyxidatus TaxID=48021 RepID=A0ACB8SEV5_9AGAM|nr:hypothetical protein BV25DRAFT_1922135 [Artomyces pyxidatus]
MDDLKSRECMGFPPDVIAGLMEGIPRDPLTGLFLIERKSRRSLPTDPPIHGIPSSMPYAFEELRVKPQTTWTLRRTVVEHIQQSPDEHEWNQEATSATRVLLHWSGSDDDYPCRKTLYTSEPDPAAVLGFVRRSIIDGGQPEDNCIATILIVSLELSLSFPLLKLFFEILPATVSWFVEPVDLVTALPVEQSRPNFRQLILLAVIANRAGHTACDIGDRVSAEKKYTEALGFTRAAMSIVCDAEQKVKVKIMMAMLLLNRTSTHFLHYGDHTDFESALLDAEMAEAVHPHHTKS